MKMTILEATQQWVYGFNAIPTIMIARLMTQTPEEWTEVTMPVIGDTVYVCAENTNHSEKNVIYYYSPSNRKRSRAGSNIDIFRNIRPFCDH